MTHIYTELELRKLKGQALKDVWHAMIGKPAGLKNTTGLKNSEEIIQAILLGQSKQEYIKQITGRQHTPLPPEETKEEEMPPKEKKKPGPKPKPKSNPIIVPAVTGPVKIHAVESMDPIQKKIEVERIQVRKLHVGDDEYFLDKKTMNLYTVDNNRPGILCGQWNPDTKEIIQA